MMIHAATEQVVGIKYAQRSECAPAGRYSNAAQRLQNLTVTSDNAKVTCPKCLARMQEAGH